MSLNVNMPPDLDDEEQVEERTEDDEEEECCCLPSVRTRIEREFYHISRSINWPKKS